MPSDLEQLVALMAAQAAQIGELTAAVGALTERVAQGADPPSAPARDLSHIVFSTESGYEPLVPMNEENQERRARLAISLGVFGEPAGATVMNEGARGLYRQLDRGDGGPPKIADPAIRMMIADAGLEDEREAIEMSHDLLKVWDPAAPPAPGGVAGPAAMLYTSDGRAEHA